MLDQCPIIFQQRGINMQIVKRKRRTQYDQKQYLFTLRSQKTESSKYDIEILFNPKFQREPFPPEQTFPQFNNDHKYYTSAFILGVDKKILLRSEQQEIMDHQRQVRESLERHRLLALPRPRSQRTLCSVCKQHYQNYHIHIASKEHKNNITQNPYNKHLKGLCKIYQELWEGAQERAELEQILQIEQMKKNQLIEQEEQASEELQDVDVGQQEQIVGEENNFIQEHQNNITRKKNKSNFDQIGHEKGGKERRPSLDKEEEWNPRKKFKRNKHHTVERPARERQQRRYQRQRNKLKTIRDEFPQLLFEKKPENDDDVFVIFKSANATQIISQKPVQDLAHPNRHVNILKKQLERLLDRKEKDGEKNCEPKGWGEKLKRGTSTTGSSLRKDEQILQQQKLSNNDKVNQSQGKNEINLINYQLGLDQNQNGYSKQYSQKNIEKLPGYSAQYLKKINQRVRSPKNQQLNPLESRGIISKEKVENITHQSPHFYNPRFCPQIPEKINPFHQSPFNKLRPENQYQAQNSQFFERPPFNLAFPQFNYKFSHYPNFEGCLPKLQADQYDNFTYKYPFPHIPLPIAGHPTHIINPHYGYEYPYYGSIQQLQGRMPYIFPSFTHYLPVKQEPILPQNSIFRKQSNYSDSHTNKEEISRRHHYAPRQPQNTHFQLIQHNLQRRRS